MRVVLSAAFGAGAFYYAEQLSKRGHLSRFLTSRPDAFRYRIDRSRIALNAGPEVLAQVSRRLSWLPSAASGEYLKAQWFDRWASQRVGSCDVVVAFAAFGLNTLREARRRNAVAVLERGSAHIAMQRLLVDEECQRFGLRPEAGDTRLFEKQLLEYEETEYIAVPSRFAFDSYVNAGVASSRLVCVPLGVDAERFRPGPKADDVFRILIFGGGLRKGTPYLLEAFERLRLPNSELVIVGAISGEMEPLLKRYHGLYRSIGRVPHRSLATCYRQGSVLVAPSIEDGWGLVVGEALACGLPVIVSRNTGAADMVRDGSDGFIVPIRDVDSIADRILTLYERKDLRQQMSHSAVERAAEYTWDRYGERIAGEYARLVGQAVERGCVAASPCEPERVRQTRSAAP